MLFPVRDAQIQLFTIQFESVDSVYVFYLLQFLGQVTHVQYIFDWNLTNIPRP